MSKLCVLILGALLCAEVFNALPLDGSPQNEKLINSEKTLDYSTVKHQFQNAVTEEFFKFWDEILDQEQTFINVILRDAKQELSAENFESLKSQRSIIEAQKTKLEAQKSSENKSQTVAITSIADDIFVRFNTSKIINPTETDKIFEKLLIESGLDFWYEESDKLFKDYASVIKGKFQAYAEQLKKNEIGLGDYENAVEAAIKNESVGNIKIFVAQVLEKIMPSLEMTKTQAE